MCTEKPRVDCRSVDCSKSNRYVPPADRRPGAAVRPTPCGLPTLRGVPCDKDIGHTGGCG